MIEITLSPRIKSICPEMTLAVLYAEVENTLTPDALWREVMQEAGQIKAGYRLDEINKRPSIFATRHLYKQLGKDPNRYRPSAEALSRRIVRGLPLYQVNTLVDIINLISIRSGYSIGGFDADKIHGNLTQGVGRADDKFEAIGRGLLNVDGLPVYRDEIGGIGTPTSDNERTKIAITTQKLLAIVNAFDGGESVEKTMEAMIALLQKYASLKNFSVNYLK
jgi:DNA/RNA-binding domain of Phe-tRNA-synthetase-like protein